MRKIYFFTLLLISMETRAQQMMDGPDSPDVNYSYSATGFSFELYNQPSSNNYSEAYEEWSINFNSAVPDSSFRFQGYLIYQVTNMTDFTDDWMNNHPYAIEGVLSNPAIARLVGQSDIVDTNVNFVNYSYDSINMQCQSYTVLSNAANSGIVHNYDISTDAFSGGSFIPGNEYCFIFLSYAVNGYYMDSGCSNKRPVMISKKGASGAFTSLCLDPATASIPESEKNRITVHFNDDIIINSEIGSGDFTLYSGNGKLIRVTKINSGENRLNCEGLNTGIYYYHFLNGSMMKTGKIFLNKN